MNWIRPTSEDGSDLFVRANHIVRIAPWQLKSMTRLTFVGRAEVFVREDPQVVMSLCGERT